MKVKKSRFRIIPSVSESTDTQWLLKEGNLVIGTFLTKHFAELRKDELEKNILADFLLAPTSSSKFRLDFQ